MFLGDSTKKRIAGDSDKMIILIIFFENYIHRATPQAKHIPLDNRVSFSEKNIIMVIVSGTPKIILLYYKSKVARRICLSESDKLKNYRMYFHVIFING